VDDFDAFIDSAWATHAEQPQATAERLAASLPRVETADQVPRYASLVTHVYGEHLGDIEGGIALLQRLGAQHAGASNGAAQRALARHVATLRQVAGDPAPLAALDPEDRVAALAAAAAIHAGRSAFDAALDTFAQALQAAEAGLPDTSPATRALAIGANNLAAGLEEKTDRDARQTAGMVDAARAALTFWKRAGTWLEEERAEYRFARSLLQAGRATEAVERAHRCVEICERHQAPPFERFFAHVVLALAQRSAGDGAAFDAARAQARLWHAQVPADEQTWCASDLQELAD
jgi:hypothetical protein